MTWKTLIDLLAREFRILRRMPVVNFGFASQPVTDATELQDEERGTAERIDGIVRDFARTRRWPALDERERFFLRERIRFAYEYCAIAEISVQQPLRIAGREHICNGQRRLIEWLLIDVWRTSGVANWLDPLFLLTHAPCALNNDWELQVAE
jgi:hypothetical protein